MKTLILERKELLNNVLTISSLYLDLNKELIFKSKSEEYTDARHLIIKILTEYYSDGELAKITGMTKMCINNIKNKFNNRLAKKSLQYTYSKLKDKLQNLL